MLANASVTVKLQMLRIFDERIPTLAVVPAWGYKLKAASLDVRCRRQLQDSSCLRIVQHSESALQPWLQVKVRCSDGTYLSKLCSRDAAKCRRAVKRRSVMMAVVAM